MHLACLSLRLETTFVGHYLHHVSNIIYITAHTPRGAERRYRYRYSYYLFNLHFWNKHNYRGRQARGGVLYTAQEPGITQRDMHHIFYSWHHHTMHSIIHKRSHCTHNPSFPYGHFTIHTSFIFFIFHTIFPHLYLSPHIIQTNATQNKNRSSPTNILQNNQTSNAHRSINVPTRTKRTPSPHRYIKRHNDQKCTHIQPFDSI